MGLLTYEDPRTRVLPVRRGLNQLRWGPAMFSNQRLVSGTVVIPWITTDETKITKITRRDESQDPEKVYQKFNHIDYYIRHARACS